MLFRERCSVDREICHYLSSWGYVQQMFKTVMRDVLHELDSHCRLFPLLCWELQVSSSLVQNFTVLYTVVFFTLFIPVSKFCCLKILAVAIIILLLSCKYRYNVVIMYQLLLYISRCIYRWNLDILFNFTDVLVYWYTVRDCSWPMVKYSINLSNTNTVLKMVKFSLYQVLGCYTLQETAEVSS